MNIQCDCIQYF